MRLRHPLVVDVAVARVLRSGRGGAHALDARDAGRALDGRAVDEEPRRIDRDALARHADEALDVVLRGRELRDRPVGEAQREAEEREPVRPAAGAVRRGGRGFVAEDERRGGGREDDGLVAPRGAQVPEDAVHEDLVAGDDVAAAVIPQVQDHVVDPRRDETAERIDQVLAGIHGKGRVVEIPHFTAARRF